MKPTSESRILIVEDDPLSQQVLKARLEMDGYQVAVASDGREGMKMIVSWCPDVVISDWMMPHVDGLELCQAIKTGLRDSAPYFILLSARGEVADRARALETGADDYIVKPGDPTEVLARVRIGMRMVGLMREARSAAQELHVTLLELATVREELGRRTRLLPLCEGCGSLRVGPGHWEDLRTHLVENRDIEGGDALCPRCSLQRSREQGDQAAAA